MWETTSPFYFYFKTISPSFSWDKNNYPTHCSTRFDKKKKKILLGKKTKKTGEFFFQVRNEVPAKTCFWTQCPQIFFLLPFFYRTFFLFLLYKNVHEKHFWETKWRKTFRVKYFLFSGDFFYFSNRDFTAETNITFCFLLIFFPMTCFNWWKKNKGFKND